ncbi:hypothetical protein Tco_0730396 [Tanacetum coccineum]|uniref:Uncharacterized protein n=1 Tax=Tanacetum coccineum TaxID=301880 RepID=A0ABQ4YU54_9ASTR
MLVLAYGCNTSSGYNYKGETLHHTLMNSWHFILLQINPVVAKLDLEDLEKMIEFDLEKKGFENGRNQDIRRRDVGNTGYKEKDNRRRPGKQEEPKALVTLNGDGVDWIGHAEDEQIDQLGDASIEIKAYTLALEKVLVNKVKENVLYDEALMSVFDSHISDIEDAPVYDRFAKVEGMHAVPPPMTGN